MSGIFGNAFSRGPLRPFERRSPENARRISAAAESQVAAAAANARRSNAAGRRANENEFRRRLNNTSKGVSKLSSAAPSTAYECMDSNTENKRKLFDAINTTDVQDKELTVPEWCLFYNYMVSAYLQEIVRGRGYNAASRGYDVTVIDIGTIERAFRLFKVCVTMLRVIDNAFTAAQSSKITDLLNDMVNVDIHRSKYDYSFLHISTILAEASGIYNQLKVSNQSKANRFLRLVGEYILIAASLPTLPLEDIRSNLTNLASAPGSIDGPDGVIAKLGNYLRSKSAPASPPPGGGAGGPPLPPLYDDTDRLFRRTISTNFPDETYGDIIASFKIEPETANLYTELLGALSKFEYELKNYPQFGEQICRLLINYGTNDAITINGSPMYLSPADNANTIMGKLSSISAAIRPPPVPSAYTGGRRTHNKKRRTHKKRQQKRRHTRVRK
jgi:hypothetical protein